MSILTSGLTSSNSSGRSVKLNCVVRQGDVLLTANITMVKRTQVKGTVLLNFEDIPEELIDYIKEVEKENCKLSIHNDILLLVRQHILY